MVKRSYGALSAIKARAPVVGGNFGVWGGLFSTFDCTVKAVRKKKMLGMLSLGFFTGGALAIRGGWKHTRNSAITCACLLGVFEGWYDDAKITSTTYHGSSLSRRTYCSCCLKSNIDMIN